MTGESIEFHNQEINGLCYSPNIRTIISRRMRWVGHEARNAHNFFGQRAQKAGFHGKDQDLNGRIILKCSLEKTGLEGAHGIHLVHDRGLL